ncbi:flavodoxin family protein [Streptomyces lonarensis]|uniref:NAD(P)H-dependent oxidoreductase n=1 Tax=Streptomyces lonarensis TaxID=700599 RepID=A0A7X6D1C6_9ACTN|nr:NAD(P)H-dependent oxidoreductase [Streptomyces lonarensis]NJQ06408.1 NAD(P)H-dependent oxidoreductase [Streptomyces lonarensis]
MTTTPPLRALAVVCTLNRSPAASSSQLLAEQVLELLAAEGATTELVRAADHTIPPGVAVDVGEGDDWPALRERVLACDILLLATPIWLGHPSSVAQRVLERLNADISETDDEGRPLLSGRVGAVAVVGNEDGAHKVAADLFQGLSDIGFTLPPQAVTYWVGEAMQGTDYQDLAETPEKVRSTSAALASTAAHLARVLRERPFPAPPS